MNCQEEGMAFIQADCSGNNDKPGRCYHCNQLGHWKRDCLLKNKHSSNDEIEQNEDVEKAVGFILCTFLQRFGKELNPDHIYLDTCTTFSQVMKDEFLTNVQHTKSGLMVHCNADTIFIDQFGYLGKMKV